MFHELEVLNLDNKEIYQWPAQINQHTEIIDRWLEQAGPSVTEYNFYQLVELLNKMIHQNMDITRDSSDIIRFKSHSNVAFPTRDVVSLKNATHQYELEVAFLATRKPVTTSWLLP